MVGELGYLVEGANGSVRTEPGGSPSTQRFRGTVPAATTAPSASTPLAPSQAFSKVAEKIISLLASRLSTKVEVTVEITAEDPRGLPRRHRPSVSENARTLHFGPSHFESI